ncbi:MAG: hypothetical protein B7Z37_05825 [Verrucomicrobia bacterium 12-59-8]|nr:MAG: hypothetical protein B7Z37_05825 [Verrucomicrobia bacterium 12-59-8]
MHHFSSHGFDILRSRNNHPVKVHSIAWFSAVILLLASFAGVRAGAEDASAQQQNELFTCASGPWGRVGYYYFYLEAPDYVVEKFPLPNTTTKWVFNVNEFDRIEPLLKNAGMAQERLDQLLAPRRVVKDTQYAYVFPSAADVESLTAENRAIIYNELARNPANVFQYSPVFFLTDSVEEWAKDSGLSAAIVTKISRLSYKAGSALVFADIPLLLSQAADVAEARYIMRKLTRVRTLMAQLELSKEDSIPDLLNYWSTGLGLRQKELEPLMQAIIRTKGLAHLDILHLVPPLPRKLLYTYPDISYAAEGRLPDCHWTSLNFFNLTPQPFLLDTRLATSLVKQDFDKVEPPYRYGDVLMFITPDGRAVHSATYLADDILFSKNGSNLLTPWLLMRLQDLSKLYDIEPGKTRIVGFRHKK